MLNPEHTTAAQPVPTAIPPKQAPVSLGGGWDALLAAPPPQAPAAAAARAPPAPAPAPIGPPLDWPRVVQEHKAARAAAARREPTNTVVLDHHNKEWGADVTAARTRIGAMAASYFFCGLAKSTQDAQDSAVRSYTLFCDLLHYDGFPAAATEDLIIAFSVWSSTRILAESITKYVGHVRSKHLELGLTMPTNEQMPRWRRVMRGIEYIQRAAKDGRVRLPITWSVLVRIIQSKWVWFDALPPAARPGIYSLKHPALSTALFCTAFFGCCRPGEVSVRTTSHGIVTSPLLWEHCVFHDDRYGDGTREVVLYLPFRKSVQFDPTRCDIAFGEIDHEQACGYKALRAMRALREQAGEQLTGKSPLFAVKNSKGQIVPVTYELMVAAMTEDLERAGYSSKEYKGHSFRLGAATTFALNGVPDHLIQDLGGWSRNSQVYKIYLGRAPQEQRAKMTAFLTRPYAPWHDLMPRTQ